MGDMGISHQKILFSNFSNTSAKSRSSINCNKLAHNRTATDLKDMFFRLEILLPEERHRWKHTERYDNPDR